MTRATFAAVRAGIDLASTIDASEDPLLLVGATLARAGHPRSV